MGRVLTLVISPTKPSSALLALASTMRPSMPHMPMALPPVASMRLTRLLPTLPASTIWAISAVSLSVTRRPFTNLLSTPIFSITSLMSGPPPWTSTTRTPTSWRSTMSSMTLALSSSFSMAWPPYFMTTTRL